MTYWCAVLLIFYYSRCFPLTNARFTSSVRNETRQHAHVYIYIYEVLELSTRNIIPVAMYCIYRRTSRARARVVIVIVRVYIYIYKYDKRDIGPCFHGGSRHDGEDGCDRWPCDLSRKNTRITIIVCIRYNFELAVTARHGRAAAARESGKSGGERAAFIRR